MGSEQAAETLALFNRMAPPAIFIQQSTKNHLTGEKNLNRDWVLAIPVGAVVSLSATLRFLVGFGLGLCTPAILFSFLRFFFFLVPVAASLLPSTVAVRSESSGGWG